jgi:hypothetical protein
MIVRFALRRFVPMESPPTVAFLSTRATWDLPPATCGVKGNIILNATKNESGNPISKELSDCRTAKHFVKFAVSRGVTVKKTKDGTVKISMNDVTVTFGPREEITPKSRKQKVKAFKAMGIAWD